MDALPYQPVDLETLIVGTLLHFPLFIRYLQDDDPANVAQFTLYKGADSVFREADRGRLLHNSVSQLFIREPDLSRYNEYLEEQLESIVRDRNMPVAKRGELVFLAAFNYVTEIFSSKESFEEKLDRGRKLSENLFTFLHTSPAALHLVKPLEPVDGNLPAHCVKVAVMVVALCSRVLDLAKDEIVEAGLGAFLHDYGKTFAAGHKLDGREKLSPKELQIVKKHPLEGYKYLNLYKGMGEVALTVILRHHEKEDGTGYPDGLCGIELEDWAKAAAIADTYCDLTSVKPYRKAFPPGEALRIIHDEMQGAFDERLLKGIREMVKAAPRLDHAA